MAEVGFVREAAQIISNDAIFVGVAREGNDAVKLGEILVADGVVTPADVDKAVERQKAMNWTITPDRVLWIKEELKGRRAAIQARYAEELKAIASDLKEIEMLERSVNDFASKHFPEGKPADASDEPVV
jgi:hypothetical protein